MAQSFNLDAGTAVSQDGVPPPAADISVSDFVDGLKQAIYAQAQSGVKNYSVGGRRVEREALREMIDNLNRLEAQAAVESGKSSFMVGGIIGAFNG